MTRQLVKWADVPFIITAFNENITAWLDGERLPATDDNPPGILINVDDKSQAVVDFDYLRLPEVTLHNDVLKVVHPHYEGLYSLQEEKGTVWVNGPNALAAFLRTLLPVILLERDGLALHSSCILKNNRAYIFTGPSGSGKSTVVKLTKNPVLYSDEVTLLRRSQNGNFKVHYAPFRSEYYTPYQPPTDNIAGVFFLRHGSRVFVEAVTKSSALPELMANVFLPISEVHPFAEKIFHLCCDFLGAVPAGKLHFKQDGTFWRSIDEYANFNQKA